MRETRQIEARNSLTFSYTVRLVRVRVRPERHRAQSCAPSPSGHPLLSGPPTLHDIHQIFTVSVAFRRRRSCTVAFSGLALPLHAHMLRALVLLFVLANSAIAFTPTLPRLGRSHLAPKPSTQAARPRVEGARPRVEGARMQSGWQAFKSGDTWRSTFGEVGPTRYDTFLRTYRSSSRPTSAKATTRSSRRKSKSSSSGSSSNWFSSYDSGGSYDYGSFDLGSFDGGSFGGGSFDGGSFGGGGFSDGGGGGGADF